MIRVFTNTFNITQLNLELIQKSFESIGDLPARIRRRARYLQACARYRLETDAVPVAGCFTTIPCELDDSGKPADALAVATNVLVDEYWDLYAVLLN